MRISVRWRDPARRNCAAPLKAAALALLGAAVVVAGPPQAQGITAPEQIRRLLQVYAALLDYRPGKSPQPGTQGVVEAGVEVLPMPAIDTRVGAKTEPVKPPPLIPRARGHYGLGSGFSAGAVIVPPVPVEGYSAALAGVAAEFAIRQGDISLGFRIFSLQGQLNGPFTDPSASDTYSLQNTGADIRVGWGFGEWSAYAGGGSGHSRTRLEISSDGSVNSAQFPYSFSFAGIGWQKERWRFTFEQEQTEAYLNHVVLTGLFTF
jgi:hypothetical protein